MMYLTFDTETTGLPNIHLDRTDPSQPHLIQFAGVVFDDMGYQIDRLITLVKPGPAAEMSEAASKVHGLSLELATTEGMDPLDVFNWFTTWTRRVKLIVGHNVHFDIQVMEILGSRLTGKVWIPPCPLFCTMVHATPIVNLPPTPRMIAEGRYHAKPPTLSECVAYLFGEELVGAHDAATDVGACMRVFRHLTLESGLAA
jgi:DNA polymerase-3 subunit epsilon